MRAVAQRPGSVSGPSREGNGAGLAMPRLPSLRKKMDSRADENVKKFVDNYNITIAEFIRTRQSIGCKVLVTR